jgi:hypothetical protein
VATILIRRLASSFWVSGVKKKANDRHWAGSGKVLVAAAALSEYLKFIGADALEKSRYDVTDSIVPTDIARFERLLNSSSRDDSEVASFK